MILMERLFFSQIAANWLSSPMPAQLTAPARRAPSAISTMPSPLPPWPLMWERAAIMMGVRKVSP